MSNTFLNCSLRTEVGSNASHRVRANGYIPGIIYGHNMSNYPLEFDKKEVNGIIRNLGENAIINVTVNGSSYTAMIKEVQRDNITGDIIHLDFQQINASEKIHTSVPIVLKGREKIDRDGILQKQLEKIEVECYPDSVPRFVSVDVSELTFGHALKISDVEFGEEISVLNDTEEVIVTLSTVKDEEVDEETTSDNMIQEIEQPELVGDESKDEEE